MLITFHTAASANLTMFCHEAVPLLKMAGHSGAVPSALPAHDIATALARLNQELAAAIRKEERQQRLRSGNESLKLPPPLGIRSRAYPLLQLLTAAAAHGCDVIWEEGARRI